jgi:hypothetical protein
VKHRPEPQPLTIGSVQRVEASTWFPFLADNVPQRVADLEAFVEDASETEIAIAKDGTLAEPQEVARASKRPGFAQIVRGEPAAADVMRCIIAQRLGRQLVVVYCRSEALAAAGPALTQLLQGLEQLPIPLDDDALIVSNLGDIYGTFDDVIERAAGGA